MLLLIDNYDSFVYNLARYAVELGHDTRVVRNDAITVDEILALEPEGVVLSPGPCDPERAGVCIEVVEKLDTRLPILGVCLGHQVIAHAYGAKIIRGEPVHGRVGTIHHDGRGIFEGVPSPFEAARYHSLIVDPDTVPDQLEVAARLADGTVMALRHRQLRVMGVQFHPESILTQHGHHLMANFLGDQMGQGGIAVDYNPSAMRMP